MDVGLGLPLKLFLGSFSSVFSSEGSTESLRTWNDDFRLFPRFCQDTLQAVG